MGYVEPRSPPPAQAVTIEVRGKELPATVVAAALRSPPLFPQTDVLTEEQT